MPIQGLQIDVKSDELVKILKDRLRHHEEKSKVYKSQAARLKETMESIDEDLDIRKVSNGDPVHTLEDKFREHQDKMAYFQFMLDHVIQNDTYRLGQEDLHKLGISAGRGWF